MPDTARDEFTAGMQRLAYLVEWTASAGWLGHGVTVLPPEVQGMWLFCLVPDDCEGEATGA